MSEAMSTPATEDLAQPSGIYSPLDSNKQSLRLFRIHPGSGDLKLKLERFCLDSDECPPFAALSYMWGDAPTHQDITINDRTFSITHNAFLFLNTLRKHQARRIEQGLQGFPRSYPDGVPKALGETEWSGHLEWIWMDSICINQADPNERNHQVRLMQKIYGLAEHVFFHIGEETQLAEKAFDLKYTKIDGQLWRRWENGGLPKIVMLDLVRVFNGSRYSRRLWIVQELVLGRQVSFVTEDLIVPLPELHGRGKAQVPGVLGRILSARKRWHDMTPGPGLRKGSRLINLLEDYRGHSCQDTRDRIYGLLGICSEPIPIDYNLSPKELFISIMAYAIAREPKKTNAVPRINSLKQSLGAALQYPFPELTDDIIDYGALHQQLVTVHQLSGSGDIEECWWYCGERKDLSYWQTHEVSIADISFALMEKLKPVYWDEDYDSTA